MKIKFIRYNHTSLNQKTLNQKILSEQVLRGLTASKKRFVYYAVPDGLTEVEAELIIDAIENNPTLLNIVANAQIRSGTPEWSNFWDILSKSPGIAKIESTHGADELRRYRISRTINLGDKSEMEDFDAKLKQDGRPSLPSFQEYWSDDLSGRSGATTKQTPIQGKDTQQNTGTTFKQTPVKGKEQPE